MSEWRERANKRRDERQAKVEIRPCSGNTKRNTKKWCRGKIGVRHEPVCVDFNIHKGTSYPLIGWKLLICTKCKKELDHWYPSPFREPQKPPDWVK